MKKLVYVSGLFFLVISQSCEYSSNKIEFHKSHEESRLNAPFSDVVETDDLLFLTGQIGKDHSTGNLVEGGIRAETKQCIENIKAVFQICIMMLQSVRSF